MVNSGEYTIYSSHCPQIGKIYMIIIICLIFSGLLTTINVISGKNNISDDLFGSGIAVNVIQILFTLYLIGIDLFGICNLKTGCNKENCKWSNIAIPAGTGSKNIKRFISYLYIPIILISSLYLLWFGITEIKIIKETFNNSDDTSLNELITISIASSILGTVGILFIIVDIMCTIGCMCN